MYWDDVYTAGLKANPDVLRRDYSPEQTRGVAINNDNPLAKTANSGIIDSRGDALNSTGAGGAIPRGDWKRMNEHAARYYEEVRHRTTDVAAISRNTGVSAEDIEIVKQHVFFAKHDLGDDEPRRFDPSYDMAVSWQKLIEGRNIHEMDTVMLQHELLEAHYMAGGMGYRQAHRLTNKQHNYEVYIKDLDRRAGIK